MGTTIFGVYVPDPGETNWIGAGELNDSLELLGKRTRNLPTDGTHGDAAHGPDYATVSQLLDPATISPSELGFDPATQSELDRKPDANTQAYSLAASGSVTLSNGKGTDDTGVTTDNGHYTVNINPDNADVAVSLDGSGANYVLHFEENSTQVGSPTVSWQLVRSEL